MNLKTYDDLPTFLLKHICSYFGLRSLACFSQTNKNNYKLFSIFNKLYLISKKLFPDEDFEKKPIYFVLKKDEKNYNFILNYFLATSSPSQDHIQGLTYNKLTVKRFKELSTKKLNLELITYLIEKKSDLNLKSKQGYTLLHFACENTQVTLDIIKILVENKIDMNTKDYNSKIPLQIACKNEEIKPEIIKYLIEEKSNIQPPKKSYSYSPSNRGCKEKYQC